MSLSGRLEDLQLRDLLQILGLSHNSGLLQLRCGESQAELLFSEGLVVSALQSGIEEIDKAQAPNHLKSIESRRHAMIPLVKELMHWDDGDFSFKACQVAETIHHTACGEHFCLDRGLGLDELLREEPIALPVSEHAPTEPSLAPAPSAGVELLTLDHEKTEVAVLLVDDDPQVTVKLVQALARQGLNARSFNYGKDLLSAARSAWKEGQAPLLIIDLIMPRLHGGGILGGLELLEQIRSLNADQLCLVYSDYPCPEVEQRLQQLAVPELLSKPMLQTSGCDDDPSATNEFCNVIAKEASTLLGSCAPVVDGDSPDEMFSDEFSVEPTPDTESTIEVPSAGMGVLKGILQEMGAVESKEQIMLLVLRFASEVLGRAVLFSVVKDHIVGLGQFGYGDAEVSADEKVRQIRLPLAEPSSFTEILERPMARCGALGEGYWDTYLRQQLGLSNSNEVFIGPLISGGQVVAFLCGDNLNTRHGIADSYSLEIILQQAGITLENLKMRRQLCNLSNLLGKTFDC